MPSDASAAGGSQTEEGTRYFEDFEQDLQRLEHHLRGEQLVVNDKNEIEYVQRRRPFLNESGINDIMATLRMTLSKNTTLSNLENNIIYRVGKYTARAVRRKLFLNAKHYDLSAADFCTIMLWVNFTVMMALQRAYQGKERDLAFGALQERKGVTYHMPYPVHGETGGGGGITGKIKGFFGGGST
jgi:hypothetical protein